MLASLNQLSHEERWGQTKVANIIGKGRKRNLTMTSEYIKGTKREVDWKDVLIKR